MGLQSTMGAQILSLPVSIMALTGICVKNYVGITKEYTRQLPIGAGHCQWDGLTDRNNHM